MIILLIYSVVMEKRNIPVELFIEALRDENSGHFEEAMVTYEIALGKFKKMRSHSQLRNKIVEKIKLLHTVIEYKNSFHFSQAPSKSMLDR